MNQRSNKGITLIALVITIILLLILATVTIRAIQGDKIIKHAEDATSKYLETQKNEQEELLKAEYEMAKAQGTITGTYGEYAINKELNKKYPGLKLGDKINYTVDGYTGEWRVLGIENGELLVVATTTLKQTIWINGTDTTLHVWDEESNSYKNAEEALDNECMEYLNKAYATKARSIRIEDIDKITGYDKTTYGKGTIEQYGNKVTYSIENEKVKYTSDIKSDTTEHVMFEKPLGTSNITKPFTITSNYYSYNPYKETNLNDKNSKVYKMLFGNDDQAYWLASSCIRTCEGIAYFELRSVSDGNVGSVYLWISQDRIRYYSYAYPVRPVISLSSSIKLTETNTGSGEWNIE